jgi:hypothetical protein
MDISREGTYNLKLGLFKPGCTSNIISGLSRAVEPAIPAPRLLGRSEIPLTNREIAKIHIYPEMRSYRIDICWEKEKPDRWIKMPYSLLRELGDKLRTQGDADIWITHDEEISSECPMYDLIIWRNRYLFLATSPIHILFEIFGMTVLFVRWLGLLIKHGEIPIEEQPLLRQCLAEAGVSKSEDLLSSLVLPFDRRFGDILPAGERGAHIFANDR